MSNNFLGARPQSSRYHTRCSSRARYLPVADSLTLTIVSGLPSATILPPSRPPRRPQVNDPIRGLDDVQIVLDHNDGVSLVTS